MYRKTGSSFLIHYFLTFLSLEPISLTIYTTNYLRSEKDTEIYKKNPFQELCHSDKIKGVRRKIGLFEVGGVKNEGRENRQPSLK